MDTCVLALTPLSPTYTIYDPTHGSHRSCVSINVIKALLPRQAQRAISEVILESVKSAALTVMGINILSENR